jgi:hypothetical protein
LRLKSEYVAERGFYFKGDRKQIAVCVCGRRKKTRKVDSQAVERTDRMKNAYWAAVSQGTLRVEERK